MATGSVSATKFRAAAFGGCKAPAGDGRGPERSESSGRGCRPSRRRRWVPSFDGDRNLGHCLLSAFPDRPRGAASLPHRWVKTHGVCRPSWGPFKPRKQAEQAGCPPLVFPGERLPAPVCQSEGAVPPAAAAAVRHGEGLGCPRVRVRPAGGAAAGARGGAPPGRCYAVRMNGAERACAVRPRV